MEAPHLVDGLPLPLAPEHDHGAAAERDRGVGVEAARAWLAADWVPAPGAWTQDIQVCAADNPVWCHTEVKPPAV